MTSLFDMRSQQELELLRRLAVELEDLIRFSSGVHSERVNRVEPWAGTDVASILRAVRVLRSAEPNRWENYPAENESVLIINGQRMKLVPVEPDERMVKDDNATDPTSDAATGQPLPFLHSETVRYIYKQLLRVAPPIPATADIAEDLLLNLSAKERVEVLSRFNGSTGERCCALTELVNVE